jgi:hypothetical protein
MSTDWTDELKAEVVAAYEEREPTPENTSDILVELSEEFEKTVNGIRMILTKAGVYVKKTPAKKAAKEGSGGTRVNKAEAIEALSATIEAEGAEVDEAILSKLTGKAAIYFTSVIKTVTSD